jgi:hypothetical protein
LRLAIEGALDLRSISTRFIPTSMTVAPGFTNAAVTNPGFPIAATRMSGGDGREIPCPRMTESDGRVSMEQQWRSRLANNVASAYHDGAGTGARRRPLDWIPDFGRFWNASDSGTTRRQSGVQ